MYSPKEGVMPVTTIIYRSTSHTITSPKKLTKTEKARAYLRFALADKPQRRETVIKYAEKNDITARTLDRASVGFVYSTLKGFGKGRTAWWSLREADDDSKWTLKGGARTPSGGPIKPKRGYRPVRHSDLLRRV